jgi:hypothetical protein
VQILGGAPEAAALGYADEGSDGLEVDCCFHAT